MKKLILFSLVAVSAAMAQGPRGMFSGDRQPLVTGAPYSAVLVSQSNEVLTDGNRIVKTRSVAVARDGQGRVRTEETIKPRGNSTKPAFTVVTILDYVAGKRYVLDSSDMTANQSSLRRPREGDNLRPAPTPGSKTLDNGATLTATALPAQHINGVLATGTQITETIPAGAIGNTQPIVVTRITWVGNDLKVPVQIKSSDPRFGTTSMELTNVVLAEPSTSLFAVPAGYRLKGRGDDDRRR